MPPAGSHLFRRLLLPAGAAYGLGAAARVWAYRRGLLGRHGLQGSVISVGNLSMGGSGKTPVVARVATLLREAGCPVAVLSRGYGGSFRGDALVVSDGAQIAADAEAAGDEPVMLARGLPGVIVAVGRRRDRVGRALEARFGPLVHVLDDGFQHLRLRRDLDVLCLDGADLADRPLPAGRLREFPSAAARADLVLVTGERSAAITSGLPPERVFALRRRVVGLTDLEGGERRPPARAYLISGIARPRRLADDAAAHGIAVVHHRAFADHHRFTPEEVADACAQALALGAEAVVTTAKDAVRLPPGHWPLPVLVLRIEAAIADEARFRERLLAVVRRAA